MSSPLSHPPVYTDLDTGSPGFGTSRRSGPLRDERAFVVGECGGCGREAGHLVHAYWGDLLCGECCVRIADELDERRQWPLSYWDTPIPAGVAFLVHGLMVIVGTGLTEPPAERQRFLGRAHTFVELAALVDHCATEVWISAGAIDALGAGAVWLNGKKRETLTHPFFAGAEKWTVNLPEPGFARYGVWEGPGGQRVILHAPCFDKSSPFNDRDAHGGRVNLMGEVAVYTAATKGALPWKGSPGITSDAWIRRHYRRRNLTTEEPPGIGAPADPRISWHRPLTDAERAMSGVVGFDLNLAYVAAASSISLGIGTPTHVADPVVEEKIPGYWRIDVDLPEWDHLGAFAGRVGWAMRPPPWRDGAGEKWVTTPVAHLLAREFDVAPSEAWVWLDTGRFLTPWYELLRDARDALLPSSSAAMQAVKDTGRAGLGRLGSDGRSDGTRDLALPYWNQAVIAECRMRLLRRLSKLARAPFALNVDAVYFTTNRRQPALAAVELGIPLGSGFGEFKPVTKGLAGELAPVVKVADSKSSTADVLASIRASMKGASVG